MNGGLAKDGLGDSADDALRERVGRLEAEVGALRGELAALRNSVPPAVAMESTSVKVESGAVVERSAQGERLRVQASGSLERQSLESQLGTRVLSKVAVVLLLVGVAWFLKWAFDNRWIGPTGRVAAGLLVGAGVILWSERFRRQQMAGFSYALKAVGSGVLYLSLWASFQLYHLAPAWAAFAAMVVVTAWNAVMAWSQDAQLLAGYALLGAYLTPLLLRTGGDHEVFLFSYLLAVAAALLALLRVKGWSGLLVGALGATSGLFIAWYAEFFAASGVWTAQASRTVLFALLLWGVFAAAPLLMAAPLLVAAPLLAGAGGSVVRRVLAPVGAALFGVLTIYSVLADSGGQRWEWWSAAGFAAVYLVLAWAGSARVRLLPGLVDAAATYLALGVGFVTTATTLKATGRGITAGWLVEAVALLVAGFWRRAAAARWLGLMLLGAGLIKTFAWDMRDLGAGYRVLSYLGLGVLLMAVSFAYQKDWLGLRATSAEAEAKQRGGEQPTSGEAKA